MFDFDILLLFIFKRVGVSLLQRTAKEDIALPYKIIFRFDLQQPSKNISVSKYFTIAIDSQEKLLKTIYIYLGEDAHLFGII